MGAADVLGVLLALAAAWHVLGGTPLDVRIIQFRLIQVEAAQRLRCRHFVRFLQRLFEPLR